jgi:hypothetical protein
MKIILDLCSYLDYSTLKLIQFLKNIFKHWNMIEG